MSSGIIDSKFLKDLFGTEEMRAVFDDSELLQRWLDVEAALALAESELGLIPPSAAEEIARCAKVELLDVVGIKAQIDETVHPIVPVIRALADVCEGDAGKYVHWGATTQDIMDTANVLQIKRALGILERNLAELSETLATLATRHRDTLMAGRTHGQHALPITFGFKAAVWLDEVRRHQQRLVQVKPRVLVGQFGGAVGTLASVNGDGLEIQRRMMEHLGLGVAQIPWHTARDNVTEFTANLGMISATCGKIADEIVALQSTEIAEVEEPFHPGKVGSSTMPHKRNPMLSEAIVALARLVMTLVPASYEAMMQEHERDWARQHMFWAYLPDMCIMTDGAATLLTRVLDGLRIDQKRMQENIERTDGLILSEAVMLALGARVGRQAAHEAVYACAMRAVQESRPFRETLLEDPLVAEHLSDDEIGQLMDPSQYTGLAGAFVDRVVGHVAA